jgi:ABC-2 type transport system ATP-binding protein
MWEDVLRLRQEEGGTIVLTTRYMDEAEYAKRIAIIDRGEIVALGWPDALERQAGGDMVEVATMDARVARRNLADAGFRVHQSAAAVGVFTANGEAQVAKLVETVGVPVTNVHVHRPTVDDVFMYYTGRQIRQDHAESALPARPQGRFAHRR